MRNTCRFCELYRIIERQDRQSRSTDAASNGMLHIKATALPACCQNPVLATAEKCECLLRLMAGAHTATAMPACCSVPVLAMAEKPPMSVMGRKAAFTPAWSPWRQAADRTAHRASATDRHACCAWAPAIHSSPCQACTLQHCTGQAVDTSQRLLHCTGQAVDTSHRLLHCTK